MTVLSLAACSPSSDSETDNTDEILQDTTDGATGGTVAMMGSVSISQQNEGSAFLESSFIRINTPQPAADVIGSYKVELDTCQYSENGVIANTDPEETTPDDDALVPTHDDFDESISAGEVILLTSPAGTLVELHREICPAENYTGGTQTLYVVPDGSLVTGPVPADLTLDIPGDVFPAFANVAVPAIESLQVLSPATTEPVTASTTFSWTASTVPDTVIQITARKVEDPISRDLSLTCWAIDDGSFTVPESVRTKMDAGFSATGSTMNRSAVSLTRQGSSVLVIENYMTVAVGAEVSADKPATDRE